MQEGIKFQEYELDLMRQWYNYISDISPNFLTEEDLVLYDKIIKAKNVIESGYKAASERYNLFPFSTSVSPNTRSDSTQIKKKDQWW